MHVPRLIGPLGVALILCSAVAQATLLQDRFGVNPTLIYRNWEYTSGSFYTGYQFDATSLVPTRNLATVDYSINDWFGRWTLTSLTTHNDYPGTGTWPAGSEWYDVEAMYVDDDGRNIYLAIITSIPSPANGIFVDTRTSPNIPVVQGDLAIDFGLAGSQSDANNFDYNYGINLTDEVRPGSGNVTTLRNNTVGNQLYRTTGSGATGAWYLGTPNNAVSPPNDGAYTVFDPGHAGSAPYLTAVGTTTTSWYQLNTTYNGNPVQENNADTWVIEATIPLDLLPRVEAGHAVTFQFLPGCRNDGNSTQLYMNLNGDLDMPEPGTWALLSLGAVGLAWRVRRRRHQG